MLNKVRNNSQGFTLIELMIVIAIIGILAAIAIPNFLAYRDKAYCSKVETDAQSVLAALSSYFSEPANTSLTDGAQGITTLIDQEGLNLNNKGNAFINYDENTGLVVVEVGDSSGRCPRADQDNNGTRESTYWAYMGTSTSGGWAPADQATP